jgi:hypothetical protein
VSSFFPAKHQPQRKRSGAYFCGEKKIKKVKFPQWREGFTRPTSTLPEACRLEACLKSVNTSQPISTHEKHKKRPPAVIKAARASTIVCQICLALVFGIFVRWKLSRLACGHPQPPDRQAGQGSKGARTCVVAERGHGGPHGRCPLAQAGPCRLAGLRNAGKAQPEPLSGVRPGGAHGAPRSDPCGRDNGRSDEGARERCGIGRWLGRYPEPTTGGGGRTPTTGGGRGEPTTGGEPASLAKQGELRASQKDHGGKDLGSRLQRPLLCLALALARRTQRKGLCCGGASKTVRCVMRRRLCVATMLNRAACNGHYFA